MTLRGLTIDGPNTRDMDDALWVERAPDGWTVTICIADVAKAVLMGGDDDLRACELTATRYFATGNSPMLPRALSEDSLSLWPKQRRSVVAVWLELDAQGRMKSLALGLEHLSSERRVTYAEVPEILQKQEDPHHAMLTQAYTLARALLAQRRQAGAMVLYDLNNGWITTEEGYLKQVENHEETIGHLIVQELMVLTNQAIAVWAAERDIPILYRNHTARAAAPDRTTLMAQISEAACYPIRELDALRARVHLLLGRAEYGATMLGHYGLNLPGYTHFTSPIRRYADLITQRQIRAWLLEQSLPYTREGLARHGAHITLTQEAAREAKSEYLKTRDEARVNRAIEGRWIDSLDAKGFERATKIETATHETPTPAFAEAFIRRVQENRAPLIALTVVMTRALLNDAWKPLREAIVRALAARPADAVSLLAQAPQVTPGWPAAVLSSETRGDAHARTFAVTLELPMSLGALLVTGHGRQKKATEQRVAVALLAQLAGVELPSDPEELPLSPTPAPVTPSPPDATKNPIVALHEWAQRTGLQAPAFVFELSGPAHAPTVTCRGTLGVHTGSGVAPNKKDAKRAAAADLLAGLLQARAAS